MLISSETDPARLTVDELISENESLHQRLRQLEQSGPGIGANASREHKDALLFQGVFQAGPSGMALTSRGSEFIDVNEPLCRMLGCDKEELIGRCLSDFMHPDDAALDTTTPASRLVRIGPSWIVAPALKRASYEVEDIEVRKALQCMLWHWY